MNLILREASAKELEYVRTLHSEMWSGGLSVQDYLKREQHIGTTTLTKDGGITAWVLVNSAQHPQQILASSESIRKAAVIAKSARDGEDTEVEEVVIHVIGCVFTPMFQRGKGYAAVMLRRLGEKLRTWQKFYTRLGWQPHPSFHIEIPVPSTIDKTSLPPDIKFLHAKDLPMLCSRDIAALKKSLSRPSFKRRIALLPNYPVMEWHHAREEFLAEHFHPSMDIKPAIKGAITSDGKRWIVWTRSYHADDPRLYVLRIASVSEDPKSEKEDPKSEEEDPKGEEEDSKSEEEDPKSEEENLAKLFQVALEEARIWGMRKVVVWQPGKAALRAANSVAEKEVLVVHRNMDSISSIMMYRDAELGSGDEDVEWVANERFGWC